MTKKLLQHTKPHNTRHIISHIHTYITPTVHTHHPRYSTTHCTKCMRLKYIQIMPKILLQYTKAHNTRHIISYHTYIHHSNCTHTPSKVQYYSLYQMHASQVHPDYAQNTFAIHQGSQYPPYHITHTYITPTIHTHHPRYRTTHCTKCMRLKYTQILLQSTKAHNTR